jgi:hypothetical protein
MPDKEASRKGKPQTINQAPPSEQQHQLARLAIHCVASATFHVQQSIRMFSVRVVKKKRTHRSTPPFDSHAPTCYTCALIRHKSSIQSIYADNQEKRRSMAALARLRHPLKRHQKSARTSASSTHHQTITNGMTFKGQLTWRCNDFCCPATSRSTRCCFKMDSILQIQDKHHPTDKAPFISSTSNNSFHAE